VFVSLERAGQRTGKGVHEPGREGSRLMPGKGMSEAWKRYAGAWKGEGRGWEELCLRLEREGIGLEEVFRNLERGGQRL